MPVRKVPTDLNKDGKIDSRERAATSLGLEAMLNYDEKNPDRPPFKGTGKTKARTPSGDGPGCINKAGVDERKLKMFEHDEDEVIEGEVKKHPIGLFVIWLATAIALVLTWGVVSTVAWFRNDLATASNSSITGNDISTAGIVLGLFVTALILIFSYISTFLYTNNNIIITSEKLVQIRYYSLFNRKVSSLSIGDVQDVTAVQHGILPMLFNYGRLTVETAGEQDNYEFPLAQRPNEYSKLIVQCHEENLHKYGN